MDTSGPREFETQVSAFRGHQLAQLSDVPETVVKALGALYISDAEQLVAVASVDGTDKLLAKQLRISVKELQSVVSAARAVVTDAHVSELESPGEYDLSTGAFEPTDEILAEVQALPMLTVEDVPVALPASVNWVRRMPPVRNQAARGTCVAFALTALHEFHTQTEGQPRDFSEQHLYYETKQIDGASSSCGTWLVKAVRALADRGQCREEVWAYNPNAPCNNHGAAPPNARTDGVAFRLETRAVASKDVKEIKSALAAGGVVPFSIPVYDSWYRSAATRNTGRITMRIGNEQASGGHAMCLVGYQDDESAPGGGYFILRNSWGSWAAQSPYGAGYGTIPYQYIATDCWETFTAIRERGRTQKIAAGQSQPGVGWQAYTGPGGPGIYIDVDTSSGEFRATPVYVTSLGGTSTHWALTGGSAVYDATPTGFRIAVRFANGAPITPTMASTNGWHVTWIGIE
jgi:C1A family cysteine protease